MIPGQLERNFSLAVWIIAISDVTGQIRKAKKEERHASP
jgi:hypothetical protein